MAKPTDLVSFFSGPNVDSIILFDVVVDSDGSDPCKKEAILQSLHFDPCGKQCKNKSESFHLQNKSNKDECQLYLLHLFTFAEVTKAL